MSVQGGFRACVVAVAAAGVALTSCSSANPTPSASSSTTGASGSAGSPASYRRPACTPPATTPVQASPVPGVSTDYTVTSFDGTEIRAHWFPVAAGTAATSTTTGTAASLHPTVLMGPGWGMSGDTSIDGAQLFGAMNIGTMNSAGYNVLTWDPRGFGKSTGTVELDSPDFEARDVSQLISWVATLPGVQLDAPGDPAVGMVGASYGGGIQLTSAIVDCRVDAIVPTIAWHSLVSSLYKANTPKAGWDQLLIEAAATAGMRLDPRITEANQQSQSGTVDPSFIQFANQASPGTRTGTITAPTLIVQGTVDNLFTLDEGAQNYTAIAAHGVPVSMIWFCGGHGVCLTPGGDGKAITDATLAWLDRYVKKQNTAPAVPAFQFIDQNGNSYSAPAYPVPTAPTLTASGSGTLQLNPGGGSGPAHMPAGLNDPLAAVAGSTIPAKADNALNVDIAAASTALVVGAPQLSLTYSGTPGSGSAPTRVFAQIVDASTGTVLGNQVTPIDVTLDGASHTATVPLEMVVAALGKGAHLTLQLVATTVLYAQPQFGGSINFSKVSITLPVATAIQPH